MVSTILFLRQVANIPLFRLRLQHHPQNPFPNISFLPGAVLCHLSLLNFGEQPQNSLGHKHPLPKFQCKFLLQHRHLLMSLFHEYQEFL